MKKILLIIAVAALGLGSCKKEETIGPAPLKRTQPGVDQETVEYD